MVAGSFPPRISDEAVKTNKLPLRSRLRYRGVPVVLRARKRSRFFQRKNKKQVFTETFKYFAKWA
jgi:hypothetical protein